MMSKYLYECAGRYLFDVLNVNHVLWWQIRPASDRPGALEIIVISPPAAFSEGYQVRAGSLERQAQMRGESNSWGHRIRHQSNRGWQVVMAVMDSPRDEWKALDRPGCVTTLMQHAAQSFHVLRLSVALCSFKTFSLKDPTGRCSMSVWCLTWITVSPQDEEAINKIHWDYSYLLQCARAEPSEAQRRRGKEAVTSQTN